MENKYYTPTIEEFHVGFEYEAKERFGDGTIKTQEDFDNAEWIKLPMAEGELPYIERMLNGRNAANGLCGVRVKYLDREDVESFGLSAWNDTDIHIYFNNQYKTIIYRGSEINLSCVYNKRSNWLCVAVEDKWIEKSTSNTLFAGYIKNKSELSRLLKQLSII